MMKRWLACLAFFLVLALPGAVVAAEWDTRLDGTWKAVLNRTDERNQMVEVHSGADKVQWFEVLVSSKDKGLTIYSPAYRSHYRPVLIKRTPDSSFFSLGAGQEMVLTVLDDGAVQIDFNVLKGPVRATRTDLAERLALLDGTWKGSQEKTAQAAALAGTTGTALVGNIASQSATFDIAGGVMTTTFAGGRSPFLIDHTLGNTFFLPVRGARYEFDVMPDGTLQARRNGKLLLVMERKN